MAYQRVESWKPSGIELYQSDASPNGVIAPLGIGALCVVQLAGSVALWQCTVLPSTWVNLSAGGGGVPLSSVTASLATTAIDNTLFRETWNWTTATTQAGLFALSADALTTGTLFSVSSSSATMTGRLANFSTSTTGLLASGAVHVQGIAAHTGPLLQVDTATLTGTGLLLNANALTSGSGLSVISTSVAMVGTLALFQSATIGQLANGAVRVSMTGAHAGPAVQIDTQTLAGVGLFVTAPVLTTGVGVQVAGAGLTTGTLFSITTSSVGLNSTNGVLRVANLGAATSGILARFQANSTAASGLTILASGNVGLGVVAPVAQLHNAGASVLGATAIADVAAGGQIGSAATTVDVSTAFTVNQTTAGQVLTLPNPSNTTAGRIALVANIGTQSFTMYNVVVTVAATPETAALLLMWNGSAWVVVL